LDDWHNIRKEEFVKRSITYREITVAIGILVAMVIVLSLWIGVPDLTVSGSSTSLRPDLSLSVKNILETAQSIFIH